MPLPKEHTYTIEDICNLPDGIRAELIDGQIYYMAPPNTTHQRILSYLNTEISIYIRSKNGLCEVFPAPFAVFLNADDEQYIEPDISIICDSYKLNDKGCIGAPDWTVEIVSPSSKRMDYYTKLYLYKTAGVREYWIIDPLKQAVIVYDMEHDDGPALYSFNDSVKVNIYDDLEIDFSKLNI